MAKIKIENVVASTSLGEELDLQAIALALEGAEYEPEQFRNDVKAGGAKTATLLFRSARCMHGQELRACKSRDKQVAKR